MSLTDQLRERHYQEDAGCHSCAMAWPCYTEQVLRTLAEAEAQRDAARGYAAAIVTAHEFECIGCGTGIVGVGWYAPNHDANCAVIHAICALLSEQPK